MESQKSNTRNSTSAIVRYVLGPGLILFGLVLTMTIILGMYEGLFAFIAIIALWVDIAILTFFKGWQTTCELPERVG